MIARAIPSVFVAAAILGVGGCAGPPLRMGIGAEPLPDPIRRQVTAVQVVTRLAGPPRLTEAARGAAAGMGRGAVIGAVAPLAGGDLRFIILVPVTAVIGAVGGAIAADARAKVEAEERALRDVLSDARIDDCLRVTLERHTRERAGLATMDPREGGDPAGTSVLEVRIEVRLDGEFAVSPSLTLVLPVTTGFRRTGNDVAHEHQVTWVGATRERGEWLVSDARPLRDEIAVACASLAERIADDLYFVVPALKRGKR